MKSTSTLPKTNWRHNRRIFFLDSVVNWLYIPIGVWVLIQTQIFTYSQITLLHAIGLAWSVILELPSGALADLIGRKRTIVLGRLALFAGYCYLYFHRDFSGFLIWQLAYYTDSAMNSGAQSALIYDSLKENGESHRYQRTEADAFMYATIGMAAGAALSGYLFKLDWFLPYTIMIPITLVGFLISLFYQEPSLDSEKFTLRAYFQQNVDGIKHILDRPDIRRISLVSLIINVIAYSGLWYLYEPRLAEGGFRPEILAYLVAGTYLIRAVATRLIPYLESRVTSHQSVQLLAWIQTITSLLSFLPGSFGAIGSVYGRKFSDGLRQPILLNLQNQHIDSKYRATSLSAISLLVSLFVSIFGLVIGPLMDSIGTSTTLGLFGILGLLLALPTAYQLGSSTKIQKPTSP